MPYIQNKQRVAIDQSIDRLINDIHKVIVEPTDFAGILNYTCTRLALGLIPAHRYWSLALVAGVFQTLNLEFYRRVVVPYEDFAIDNNGDLREMEERSTGMFLPGEFSDPK